VIAVAAVGLGLLIGLSLGALGGGGSVLTVPALVYVIGQDAQSATTSSLFIVGLSAVVGALGHARSGRVRWGVGLVFGVVGVAASFAGTALNHLVDPDVLLLAFAGVVLVAATGMLAQRRTASAEPVPERPLVRSGGPAVPPASPGGPPPDAPPPSGPGTTGARHRWTAAQAGKVVAAALLVGFMTGFFGVGGGFVVVPALVLALRMPMPQAVATSLLVIALNSGSSLAARAGSASFDWPVIVPFTLAAMAGSLAGKRVADRLSGRTLTLAFAVLLIAVAVYTATASIIGLAG
jgi:uncharacterized membrane protein YfcA